MAGMENFSNFNALDGGADVNITPDGGNGKEAQRKLEKKKRAQEIIAVYNETLRNNPELTEVMNSRSSDLKVLNTLGFGDSGNIVAGAGVTADNKRNLVATSQIVGYRVQNIGQAPIEYTTERWVRGENGQFAPEVVTQQLAPGETADLTRQWMTALVARPEFSFVLENGKVTRGSAATKNGDVKAELQAYYFSFSDSSMKVNSDEVKLNVGEKKADANGNAVWRVKDEFEAAFGYLNNAKEKRTRASKAGSAKNAFEAQRAQAAYVFNLLQQQGKV